MGGGAGRDGRDVVSVIVDFRNVLNEARPVDCPDIAAEYLCDLFDGAATAMNLMDYGRFRYQTITNVGRLIGDRAPPTGRGVLLVRRLPLHNAAVGTWRRLSVGLERRVVSAGVPRLARRHAAK